MSLLAQYTFPTPFGKLLSSQPFPNGNMVGYTAQLLLVGSLPPLLANEYEMGLYDCEIKKGVFSRHPESMQNTSVDDYLSAACDKYRAKRIWWHGLTHFGFFNVETGFHWKQWLWRFVGFWQHVKISAGIPVGPIGRLIWACSIMIAADQQEDNRDSWIQSHMMILTARARGYKSLLGELAIGYWLEKKMLPTWMITRNYLVLSEHPLIDAWKNIQE